MKYEVLFSENDILPIDTFGTIEEALVLARKFLTKGITVVISPTTTDNSH
jgi:hypothetical protein